MAHLIHRLFVTAFILAGSAAGWAEPLKVGSAAPEVVLKDQSNKAWSLDETLKRPEVKAVLLYFYPKDDTPGCTKQACGWRDRRGTLMHQGVETVGVSFDNASSHQRFIKKHSLNFTLLSDLNGKVAEAYGVRVPKRNLARRVSFLIGSDGKILQILDHRDAERHLTEMTATIEQLVK